jgi:hypothetical protein
MPYDANRHFMYVILAAERDSFAALVLAEQTQRQQKTRDQGVYKSEVYRLSAA